MVITTLNLRYHCRLASSLSALIDEMLDRAVVGGKIIEFIVAVAGDRGLRGTEICVRVPAGG